MRAVPDRILVFVHLSAALCVLSDKGDVAIIIQTSDQFTIARIWRMLFACHHSGFESDVIHYCIANMYPPTRKELEIPQRYLSGNLTYKPTTMTALPRCSYFITSPQGSENQSEPLPPCWKCIPAEEEERCEALIRNGPFTSVELEDRATSVWVGGKYGSGENARPEEIVGIPWMSGGLGDRENNDFVASGDEKKRSKKSCRRCRRSWVYWWRRVVSKWLRILAKCYAVHDSVSEYWSRY